MAVAVEDVKMWVTLNGVGHALAWETGGWYYLACGKASPNGEKSTTTPKSICRRCRERLTEAAPAHTWDEHR